MATCLCGCGQEPGVLTRSRPHLGYVAGQPRRFVVGHHRRGGRFPIVEAVRQYRNLLMPDGRQVSLHRVRAERALGKPLPVGAVVHHADGSKRDNAPLVICQDDAYHKFLHVRMRIKAAEGNPDTDAVCSACREAKPRTEFNARARSILGVDENCRPCSSRTKSERRQRKQIAARG
jgi:hypothetical protein